jgi:hypothetical protein
MDCPNGGFMSVTSALPVGNSGALKQSSLNTLDLPSPRMICELR